MPRTNAPIATAAILAKAFGDATFRPDQASKLGVTIARLRAAVGRNLVVRVAQGHYAVRPAVPSSDRLEHLRRVSAALARRPDAAASHHSAVAAWHLPSLQREVGVESPVVLTNPMRPTRLRRQVRTYQRPLPPAQTARTPWGPVTTPERTAFDIACTMPLPRALIVVDAVAREMSPDCGRAALLAPDHRGRLRERLRQSGAPLCGCPGFRAASAVMELADPASESPAESLSRGWIVVVGLPLPSVGLPTLGASGRRYYADLAWEDRRLIGEVDGVGKYTSSDVLLREKEREDDLRRAGWAIVRWTGVEITRTPGVVIQRIRTALS